MTRLTGFLLLLLLWPHQALAQLDPLLFLKRVEPNVVLVVDTRATMLRDADNTYYDPYLYSWKNSGGDSAWQAALGLQPGVTVANSSGKYRRKFANLDYASGSSDGNKFTADSIQAVGDLQSGYSTFYEKTRMMLARRALSQVVNENSTLARFSLLKMRQTTPSWGTNSPNETAKLVTSPADTDTNKANLWQIMSTTVSGNNGSAAANTAILKQASGTTSAEITSNNSTVATTLSTTTGVDGMLIPATNSTTTVIDTPLRYMVEDAKTEATRLINADTLCRNTIVVMVVAGGDGTTGSGNDAATRASGFTSIGGRRVPIYVIALAPPASSVTALTQIATNSGGKYYEITKAQIDATAAGTPVPEFVKAINLAVQHANMRFAEFNAGAAESEYQVTSPIIGTVDLTGAKDINGVALPDTEIENATTHVTIPQRSNLLLTTAFVLPSFEGRLRAFRQYKPEADTTKPTGYKFVKDGTKLWVACAPGTTASGPCASLSTSSRNIYTALPNGTVISFTASNALLLSPFLSGSSSGSFTFDASSLIARVRNMPLGAFVSSTPAVMDPPSIDPPPDPEYPGFAAAHRDRRSIVWVTANDGMLHAIDARLGIEVWAFIPFNLLPKLRALNDGESIGKFDYLFDGSPKVADVKIDDAWRTMLVVGQGRGGTFYQAFDVTLPNIEATVDPTEDTITDMLSYFSNSSRVSLSWAFPRYSAFDHTIQTTAAPYGDLGASATATERTVGQTWSDPAVGQAVDTSGKYVVITGSGFLSYSQQTGTLRGGVSAPAAGATLYMLNAEDGTVYASQSVGSDGLAETVDDCAAVNNCQIMKNALHADPVATGPPDSRYITKVYIGDLDGRIWRFNIGTSSGAPVFTSYVNLFNASLVGGHGNAKKTNSTQPLFSSMATVTVGVTQQYIFFGTGSDLLPSNGVTQAYQLIGFLDNGATGVETFAKDLSTVSNKSGNEEKVTAFPAVAGDIVFFTTTTFRPANPCLTSDANLYALTYTGGAAYDTTDDGRLTSQDSVKVTTIAGARATAPFVVDQHLVVGAGNMVEVFGDPADYNNGVGQVGVRILTWRELR